MCNFSMLVADVLMTIKKKNQTLEIAMQVAVW